MEVVLEVATGRRPVDDDGTVVVDWVWDLWEKGKLSEGADPRLMGKFNAVEMEIMLLEKARPITRHTLTWSRSHQPHLRGVDRGLKKKWFSQEESSAAQNQGHAGGSRSEARAPHPR